MCLGMHARACAFGAGEGHKGSVALGLIDLSQGLSLTLKLTGQPALTIFLSLLVHTISTSHLLALFLVEIFISLSVHPATLPSDISVPSLFFHQLPTLLDIHILFPHLYNPNSLYTIMCLPNVTVFLVYLFKPSIHFLPVNPSAEYPPASLWQKYLFPSPLQGNENLGCYLSIPQGRLYLVILKHSC